MVRVERPGRRNAAPRLRHHTHPLHRRRHARRQHRTIVLDARDLVVLDLAAPPRRRSIRTTRVATCTPMPASVVVARGLDLHEPRGPPVPHHVRAVEHEGVKVRVQVKRIPEALDERHREWPSMGSMRARLGAGL